MDWTAPEVFNTGFNRLLGIELVECRKGAATVRMRVTDACKNPAGIVHGGALFSLADTAGANAAVCCGTQVVTVESAIKYLRPAGVTQYLTAKAREVKRGRQISFYEVCIDADDGREIARVSLTYCLSGPHAQ